jgi:hypothetical protein
MGGIRPGSAPPSAAIHDDAGALFAIGWPGLREYVVGDVVGFDAERVLDDLGGVVTVVVLIAFVQPTTETICDESGLDRVRFDQLRRDDDLQHRLVCRFRFVARFECQSD